MAYWLSPLREEDLPEVAGEGMAGLRRIENGGLRCGTSSESKSLGLFGVLARSELRMPAAGRPVPDIPQGDLMKKAKKLKLSRETLKNLAATDLKQAAGGIVETDQPDCMHNQALD
jgi:hypothetical protein